MTPRLNPHGLTEQVESIARDRREKESDKHPTDLTRRMVCPFVATVRGFSMPGLAARRVLS